MPPLTAQDREWVSALIDSAVSKALIEVKNENTKLHDEFMRTLKEWSCKLSDDMREYVDKKLSVHRLQCQEKRFNVLRSLLTGAIGGVITGVIIDGNNIFKAIRAIIDALL